MVPIKFLQCWNGFDRGQEVNFPHPGLAEDLVRMRVAEYLQPAATPTPMAEAPRPTATSPTVRAKRK